jgi:hypothetical protein
MVRPVPSTIVTQAISEHFLEWAASLPAEEQATLATWMGVESDGVQQVLGDEGAGRRAELEAVARRLIVKLRTFSGELDVEERRMFRVLLAPGMTIETPPEAEEQIVPYGMTGTFAVAFADKLDDAKPAP